MVLLSGGLDSATTLFLARKKFQCYCLIFDYGQKHRREIESAKKIARLTKTKYYVIKISLPWKGSSLLDSQQKIPSHQLNKIGTGKIPSTYVPARNTIFLSFAVSFAEAVGAENIFIGANQLDFSGYPDCRPKYYQSFQKVVQMGTKAGSDGKNIKIVTPLINMTKEEIIRLGMKLKVPFNLTWSCYEGGTKPCGKCDACLLREKGFTAVRIKRII